MPDSITLELVRRIAALEKRTARLAEDEHPPWQKGCRVYRSTTQSIAHNTLTALSFDTEVCDTDTCWAVGDPTKLYARHAGYYLAGGQIVMTLGTYAADVILAIRKGGTNYKAQQGLYATAGKDISLNVASGMIWMDEDSYIEIIVRQIQATGSAAVNVLGASAANQQFNNGWLARIA